MRRLPVLALLLSSPAWGAFTADVMSGFETGDLTECIASGGSPSSATSAARTGERGLVVAGGNRCNVGLITVFNDERWWIWGLCVRAADATPTSAFQFFGPFVYTDHSSPVFELEWQTDGTVDYLDAGGTARISTSALSDNTWHCFEVVVNLDTDSSTGNAEVFLDGATQGTASNIDTWGAVSGFYSAAVYSTGGAIDADDLYVFADATGASDRCSASATRLCEVFWFSGGPPGATPDAGNLLDGSTVWSAMREMPLNASSGGLYSGGAQSGDVIANDVGTGSCSGGPSGCSAFDGDPISANWLLYAERGNGSGTTHTMRWGNSTDAMSTATVTLEGAPAMFRKADAGTVMPTASEYCRNGIQKSTGGRDFEGWEHWCYVLHRPPAAGAGDQLMVIGAP